MRKLAHSLLKRNGEFGADAADDATVEGERDGATFLLPYSPPAVIFARQEDDLG